ncbi:MAG: AraC family transcriptional regulator [Defluviitaleaceae bacterium]|nr:AraC family transcriptional regulator [Defluviitaleaceae bacterium]
MTRVTAYQEIQNTLEYLEKHIVEPLDINTLAAKASLSPFYFQRLFSRLVGRPIADYHRQRRLYHSRFALRDTNDNILDIALKCGFANHETFTRAFKAAYDITPKEYRNGKRIEPALVVVPDVTLRYKLVDMDVPLVSDGVILEITRRTYTHERIYAGFRSTDPGKAWDYFSPKRKSGIPFLHPQGNHAGIGLGTEKGYSCLVGCRVTERESYTFNVMNWPGFEDAPDCLHVDYVTLPPGEYLVCTYTAETFDRLVVEAMSRVIPYFFDTFIKNHNIEVCGPLIEIYDKRSLRWHPAYRIEDDVPHLEPREPKLSDWEGPEMDLEILVKR